MRSELLVGSIAIFLRDDRAMHEPCMFCGRAEISRPPVGSVTIMKMGIFGSWAAVHR